MKDVILSALAVIAALSLASCGTSEENIPTAADVPQAEVSETTAEQTETELTTTFDETTTTAVETTTTVTETEKVCACESEFQHACCEYLNGLDFLAGGVYYGDINGDDKPEAVVAINPFGLTHVLYENENGIQDLELVTVSVWGEVSYAADTRQIFFTPMRGHTTGTWGYEEHYIYDWNGTDYEVTTTFFRESGYPWAAEDGTVYGDWSDGFINGEFVEHDAFDAKLAEYEKIRDESGYFPIVPIYDENYKQNPTSETYINYIKENFPCFDNWDIIPAKEE